MSLTEAKHVVRGTKEGVYLCVVPYFACITLTTTVRKINQSKQSIELEKKNYF